MYRCTAPAVEHADAAAQIGSVVGHGRNLTRYDPAPCRPTRVSPTTDTPCCTKCASAASYRSTTVRTARSSRPSSPRPGCSQPCASRCGSHPKAAALHDAWARVVAGTETEEAVTRAYERFLPLNAEFLRLCHDWQVRPGNVPNDHGDVAYDWSVIDRLRALDERAGAGPAPRRPCTRSLRRVSAPAARGAASTSTTANPSGSPRPASTRTTRCG